MKRNIGQELATRMTHLNEMLADGESVGSISRADVDSGQAIEMPHMMSVAREWLAAENQRMAQAGETAHCGSLAHVVGWLLAEVQRLRFHICHRISELGEEMERTPEPQATPGECSVRAGRTCHRCGGDGIQLTEVNTYGEATCGTCGGSGRLD